MDGSLNTGTGQLPTPYIKHRASKSQAHGPLRVGGVAEPFDLATKEKR
ncbi:hypothetical protein [Maribacter sp. 2210JD10-5]